MRAAQLRSLCVLVAILCTGCSHKNPVTPQQAQAPPLQTGKGTLEPPKTTQQAEKTDTPLASPLPPPSAQSVPLPPPTPKKVRKPKKPKPADTTSGYGHRPRLRLRTARQVPGPPRRKLLPRPSYNLRRRATLPLAS